jgi:hypothetical protein
MNKRTYSFASPPPISGEAAGLTTKKQCLEYQQRYSEMSSPPLTAVMSSTATATATAATTTSSLEDEGTSMVTGTYVTLNEQSQQSCQDVTETGNNTYSDMDIVGMFPELG